MGHGVDDETAHAAGLKDDLGLPDGRNVSVAEASLLLCDGPVSMSRMLRDGYDLSHWRLFNISACLLGQLRELGASREVLGYIAVLTLLRCRRVASALWPLSDAAAPEFARYWVRAIRQHVFGPTPPGPTPSPSPSNRPSTTSAAPRAAASTTSSSGRRTRSTASGN
jgi:hypothetical protein